MAHAKLMMRVLLSSPSDTQAEREIISDIVEEINYSSKETPYGIELYRWEKDTDPEITLENGQKLIDKTFDYEHADMLIGLFYRNPGKWTQYEIDQAIKVKREYGFPHIILYFKREKINSNESDKLENYKKIVDLENKYREKGITGELKGDKKSITKELRRHITRQFELFKKANAREDVFIPDVKNIIINPYKLYYYRDLVKGYTVRELAKKTGISENVIRRYEDVEYVPNIKTTNTIYKNLKSLEAALELKNGDSCFGIIENDFKKSYDYYQEHYKDEKLAKSVANQKKISVVIFDFDGTLVDPHALKTTWQQLWLGLGYDLSICNMLHGCFDRKEISHQEWCDLTADYFIKKKMNKRLLSDVAKTIVKMPGLHETIKELYDSGLKMYILSGSIKELISIVLGDDLKYFQDISANSFIFDKEGNLQKIVGTEFDFEGKAEYVKNLSRRIDIPTREMLFIGNSFNDAHVYKSGANTLCVNPTRTNSHNKKYWHETIDDMKDLSEIKSHCFKSRK